MRHGGLVLVFLLLFPSTGLAAPLPAQTAALEPSSPWKVEYAPDDCRLSRSFGTSDGALAMQLKREAGLDQFEVIFAGSAVPKQSGSRNIQLRLIGQGLEHKLVGQSDSIPNRSEGFVRAYDNDASILTVISDGQQFELRIDQRDPVVLHLVGAHAALAALDKCFNDLLQTWGVDPAVTREAKEQPKPTGSPGNWATSNDYPADALRQKKIGTVTFILTVDGRGKPQSCRVIHGSAMPSLDSKTCELMMARAQFKPAMNFKRESIPGYFISRVRWVLPR